MRIRNPNLREYFQEEDVIINEEYIDEIKMNGNIRLLTLNPYRCRLNDISKMN